MTVAANKLAIRHSAAIAHRGQEHSPIKLATCRFTRCLVINIPGPTREANYVFWAPARSSYPLSFLRVIIKEWRRVCTTLNASDNRPLSTSR
jgi:hypothetical protein